MKRIKLISKTRKKISLADMKQQKCTKLKIKKKIGGGNMKASENGLEKN